MGEVGICGLTVRPIFLPSEQEKRIHTSVHSLHLQEHFQGYRRKVYHITSTKTGCNPTHTGQHPLSDWCAPASHQQTESCPDIARLAVRYNPCAA